MPVPDYQAVMRPWLELVSDGKDHEDVKSIGKRIILIDGLHLAGLLMDNEVGVVTDATYRLVRVDPGFFEPG